MTPPASPLGGGQGAQSTVHGRPCPDLATAAYRAARRQSGPVRWPGHGPSSAGRRTVGSVARLVALILFHGLTGCGGAGEPSAGSTDGFRGVPLVPPIPRSDFTLTDTEGRAFHFAEETAGRLTLLFFGYTNCPDICPVHMANLGQVLERFPQDVRSRVRVVFVSTDPERDTPARIRAWLDAMGRGFTGLRGPLEEVNRIQARFGLPPAALPAETGTAYTVGHAAQVLAFTPDDSAHYAYPFGTRQVDWLHDLPRLLALGAR